MRLRTLRRWRAIAQPVATWGLTAGFSVAMAWGIKNRAAWMFASGAVIAALVGLGFELNGSRTARRPR